MVLFCGVTLCIIKSGSDTLLVVPGEDNARFVLEYFCKTIFFFNVRLDELQFSTKIVQSNRVEYS